MVRLNCKLILFFFCKLILLRAKGNLRFNHSLLYEFLKGVAIKISKSEMTHTDGKFSQLISTVSGASLTPLLVLSDQNFGHI